MSATTRGRRTSSGVDRAGGRFAEAEALAVEVVAQDAIGRSHGPA